MLGSLGRFVVRRRVAVLVAALLAMFVAGALGGGVAKHLSGGGFEDPGAESSQAKRVLEQSFGTRNPNVVLLVTANDGSVDSAAAAAAGAALTRELGSEEGVTQAVSYWTLGSPPPLRNNDGRQALVLATIGGDDDDVAERIEHISPRFTRTDGTLTVAVGGFAEVFRQVSTQIEHDLVRAEMISLPIILILLVLVFGSVVAASLPLGIGAMAVIGTFLVLRVLASFTQVSIFALNLTTAMGMGLAIDYRLFVVSRYREELPGRPGAGRRHRADGDDRRTHRDLQCRHRGRLPRRHARVPPGFPPVVRLRRDRSCGPGRCRRRGRAARAAGRPRAPGGEMGPVAPAREARGHRLLAPGGGGGDAPPRARGHRGRPPAVLPGRPVPADRLRPAR